MVLQLESCTTNLPSSMSGLTRIAMTSSGSMVSMNSSLKAQEENMWLSSLSLEWWLEVVEEQAK